MNMFRVDVKKMAAPKTLGDQSVVLLDRMTMADILQLNIRRQRFMQDHEGHEEKFIQRNRQYTIIGCIPRSLLGCFDSQLPVHGPSVLTSTAAQRCTEP